MRPAPILRCLALDECWLFALIMKNDLPDFGIAHQPVTESYSGSMSGEEAITVVFCDGVHVGCGTCLYGIAFKA